jgi:hypothetical protein
MSERFVVVERYADNGSFSHWALVDTVNGRELGADGGEPEDQLLVRDWEWVPKELNALQAENARLREALEGIITIGKRDMSNPKYDGYFEAAREALK